MNNLNLVYDLVKAEEVERAFELECEGFPEDERATLDKLKYRQEVAPDLFFGAFTWRPPSRRTLQAFICATASSSASLTHDSMSTHESAGRSVNIHGVVVTQTLRRRGIALSLLKEYLSHLQTLNKYERVLLINHDELTPLYTKAGFELVGPSSVVHGSRPWLEMRYNLQTSTQKDPDKDARSPGLSFSTFSAPQTELLANERNKGKLYCPRRQCRGLLLNAGVATWVKRSDQPFSHELAKPTLSQPDFPPTTSGSSHSSADAFFWSIQPPNPMSFENIGFSKNIGTLKFLTCADCDCGPLGFADVSSANGDVAANVDKDQGAVEFLLAVDRVRYRLE